MCVCALHFSRDEHSIDNQFSIKNKIYWYMDLCCAWYFHRVEYNHHQWERWQMLDVRLCVLSERVWAINPFPNHVFAVKPLFHAVTYKASEKPYPQSCSRGWGTAPELATLPSLAALGTHLETPTASSLNILSGPWRQEINILFPNQ